MKAPCLPLGVGQAYNAASVGHPFGCFHEIRPCLMLVFCNAAQGLHCGYEAMQDAATLWVLLWVRWPYCCQRRHQLEQKRKFHS